MPYLLPCPQCERKLLVTTGEAGGQVRCECGASVDVPTVRGLRALPEAQQAAAAKRPWSARHSVVFLGAIIAVAGLAFGLFLQMRAAEARPRENFADDIQVMTPDKAWELWSRFLRHGIGWQPQRGETQVKELKAYYELVRWKWIGFGIAGAGLVLAIVGLTLPDRRPTRPPKRPPRRPIASAGHP